MFHESLGYHGTVCWKHAPFADNFRFTFQQVRNPINCIGSLQTIHSSSMAYMARFVDIDLSKPKLEQCMDAWLNWNLLCESKANAIFQVEHIATAWKEILHKIGVDYKAMPQLPTDTHTRKGKYEPVTCEILHKQNGELFNEIIKLAKKYGYDY